MEKRKRHSRSAPVREFLNRFQFGSRRNLSVDNSKPSSPSARVNCQLNTVDLLLKDTDLHSTDELAVDLRSPSTYSTTTSSFPVAGDSGDRISIRSTLDVGEDDKIITYKRRCPIDRRNRKASDETLFDYRKCERDEKGSAPFEVNGHTAPSSDMTTACATEVAQSSALESSPLQCKNRSSLFGSQRTCAPKRIVGQYFLDLGQSDFSYSTCRTCGMLYAPGHDDDEKVHQSFHRNYLQGIQFKGWRDERVASRIDLKGNRVIIVTAEEFYQRTKVREVVEFMELELGLTPGWLLERSCMIYLFISSAKKIVGCLMAERIESAYRVVPELVKDSGKDGKAVRSKRDASSHSTQTADLLQPELDNACEASDESMVYFAGRLNSIDALESIETDGQATKLWTSRCEGRVPGTSDRKPIFVSISGGRSMGRDTVKRKISVSSFAEVKKEPLSSEDGIRKARITDYFLLKTPRAEQRMCKIKEKQDGLKHEAAEARCTDRVYGTSQPSASLKEEPGCFNVGSVRTNLKSHVYSEQPHVDVKPNFEFGQVHESEKLNIHSKQVLVDQKPMLHSTVYLNFKEASRSEEGEQNKELDVKPEYVAKKRMDSDLNEICLKAEEHPLWTSTSTSSSGFENIKGTRSESQCGIGFDKCSVPGGKVRANVMLSGNVKFLRELEAPKQVKKEQVQDLGRAILRTREPVPAICGVRAIWVSQSERRKGIATHLLDAMRKSFVLGISLGTSQFAFSQPTPEGRKFAEQYCRTNQFLVYTTR